MGKNYYARRIPTHGEILEVIAELAQGNLGDAEVKLSNLTDQIHLGKSSAGWRFLFNHNDWKYYQDIGDMVMWLNDYQIFDEYGEDHTGEEFWKMVANKQQETPAVRKGNPDWYVLKGEFEFSTSTNFC